MAITAPNTMFTRTLAPTSALGALQHDLELILDGATKASSFTAVAVETSVTTAPSTTAGTSGIRSTENFPMLRFKFGLRDAAGTDDKTGNYKVVLYSRAATVVDGADAVPLVPEVVATGVITAGTLIYSDDIGSATATVGDMWADTITTTSKGLGVYAHSPADNTPATLMVDTRGACAYQVFVYIGTADAIDVWCQRASVMPPFDVASLVNGTALPAGKSLYDITGAFSGDGGAAADDSAKAALDLLSSYTLYNGWRMASKSVSRPTANPYLFDITGTVEAKFFCIVSESVSAGGENASVGNGTVATAYIAATVNTALDIGMTWFDATPAIVKDSTALKTYLITANAAYGSEFVLLTIGATWATAGALTAVCLWRPVYAASGSVAPAA